MQRAVVQPQQVRVLEQVTVVVTGLLLHDRDASSALVAVTLTPVRDRILQVDPTQESGNAVDLILRSPMKQQAGRQHPSHSLSLTRIDHLVLVRDVVLLQDVVGCLDGLLEVRQSCLLISCPVILRVTLSRIFGSLQQWDVLLVDPLSCSDPHEFLTVVRSLLCLLIVSAQCSELPISLRDHPREPVGGPHVVAQHGCRAALDVPSIDSRIQLRDDP